MTTMLAVLVVPERQSEGRRINEKYVVASASINETEETALLKSSLLHQTFHTDGNEQLFSLTETDYSRKR